MAQTNRVDTKASAYLDMETLWILPDDLLGGTKKMRGNGEWLPKKGAETTEDYSLRVASSYLFNGYEKTIEDLSSKPFEKPVSLEGADNLGEFLEPIEDDVDRTGKSLTAFAREVYAEGLHRGLTHVLVDFPRQGEGDTLADMRNAKARPVFIHVQAPRLLGWQTERLADGTEVLSQIRVYEETTEPDGPYGEKIVERIRVYTRTAWELHERQDAGNDSAFASTGSPTGPETNPGPDEDEIAGGDYAMIESGTHDFGEVPLITLYFKRAGMLTGKPVFENVAQLNLAHFQSASRQRNYLDFARIGTIALFGFSATDLADGGITWGVNRFIRTEKGPQEADVRTVEHGANAITAGERDLDKLETQMQVLGTAPLVERTAAMTATGEARDEGHGMSKAEAWIRDTESFLVKCYEAAARWLGQELPEDFAVNIFDDFGITMRGNDESRLLVDMNLSGVLSSETLYRELKRRGIFAESFDGDAEASRVEEEGPELPDDADDDAPPAEEPAADDDEPTAEPGPESTAPDDE